jgi:hypothetical protein
MSPAVPTPSAPSGQNPLGLAETLAILDAASTLRRERDQAARLLDDSASRADLEQRLLAAAAASGEPLGSAEVRAAIERYFDRLHAFEPAPAGWARTLALIYIQRRLWGLFLAGALIWFGGLYGLFFWSGSPLSASGRLARNLAQGAAALAAEIGAARATPLTPAAGNLLSSLERRGRELLAEPAAADRAPLAALVEEAKALRARLAESYELRIVSRPGEFSVVTRDYDGEGGKRLSGHYAIVEAVAADGRRLSLPVLDAEEQRLVQTSIWGEQIPADVYQRLADDKRADGVLDEQRFAIKQAGALEPELVLSGVGGPPISRGRQITSW